VWAGWGVFLNIDATNTPQPDDLSAFANGDIRFFVKAPDAGIGSFNVKVEFQCRVDSVTQTYTTSIADQGWDGTTAWQEIVIPLASFFSPDPVDQECLASVIAPFMITIENLPFFNSLIVDYVRWHTPNDHAAQYPDGPSLVEVQGRQLKVDGEPFVVNGVAYAPISIGENWQSAWRDRPDRYLVDFPLIAASGASAVRLYAPITTTAMLDAAWAEGLYVIPTFNPAQLQLSCAAGRQFMRDRLRDTVLEWTDHPAILFWLMGNEFNSGLSTVELCDPTTGWYPELDSLAQTVHAVDSFHPVGTANADTSGLGDICDPGCSDDTSLPNLDLWAVQVYRGCTFGGVFTQYAGKTDCDKPLIVTEFGADAWQSASHCSVTTGMPCYVNDDCPAGTCSTTTTTTCHTDVDCPASETCVGGEFCDGAGSEAQSIQADCLEDLLDEANQQLAVRTDGGVSSGQVVFEWADEWWKAECLPTTDWGEHDTCASSTNFSYTVDPAINEEWWGIVSLDSGDPDARNPRAAYTRMRDTWYDLGPVCNMEVVSHDAGSGSTDLSFDPAAGSTDHTLYYGPLNAVSSYGYSGLVTGLGTTGSSSVTLPGGSLFWVVVGRTFGAEGCYREARFFEGNCSMTTGTSCTEDADCPPTETCEGLSPERPPSPDSSVPQLANRSCQCP
jgi:hypothetical protein